MSKKKELHNGLYEAIVNIEDKKTAKRFFADLLSPAELETLCERVRCAKLLMEGKTYVEVIDETSVSSATLARISKCIKNGKGYSRVLKVKD